MDFNAFLHRECEVTRNLPRKEKIAAKFVLSSNFYQHKEDSDSFFVYPELLKGHGISRWTFYRMMENTGIIDVVGTHSIEQGICQPLQLNSKAFQIYTDYLSHCIPEKALEHYVQNTDIDILTLRNSARDAEDLKFVIAALHTNLLDVKYHQEDAGGRQFAIGDFTIQRCPKKIRNIVMRGWWDYDFKSAHTSIASGLGNFQAFDYYNENTYYVRESLAAQYGITESDVKGAIISIMYGARFIEGHALSSFLGDSLHTFKEDLFIQQFIEDRKKLQPILLKIAEEKGIKGRNKSSTCAKVLMWYENAFLEVSVEGVNNPLLMFDGFLSQSPCNVSAMEGRILDKLGTPITITEERI